MGPTREDLILDPLAVQHLDNWLYILYYITISASSLAHISKGICISYFMVMAPFLNYIMLKIYIIRHQLNIPINTNVHADDRKNNSLYQTTNLFVKLLGKVWIEMKNSSEKKVDNYLIFCSQSNKSWTKLSWTFFLPASKSQNWLKSWSKPIKLTKLVMSVEMFRK